MIALPYRASIRVFQVCSSGLASRSGLGLSLPRRFNQQQQLAFQNNRSLCSTFQFAPASNTPAHKPSQAQRYIHITASSNMADSTQTEEPRSNATPSTTMRTQAKNDLSDMRKPYRDQDDGIEESKLPTREPIKLFKNWFEMVKESGTVYEPNAFSICTASQDGQPSARMVLLKGFDEEGFRFFTHYSSQKGRNIDENPKVCMLFYWDSFNRQVRIEGRAERLPQEAGEAYFKRRPQSSQIGAAISDQCSLVESREELMRRYDSLKAQLGDQPPAKPPTWGGFLIRPERFEFWQGNTNRVHDRIMFRRPAPGEQPDGKLTKPAEGGWVMERMLP